MTGYFNCPYCDEEITCDFTPSRPAPFCQNHDSPAFSDPGDSGDCDAPEECPFCKEALDTNKVLELLEEKYANRDIDYDEDSSLD